jgi:hypothetical protein
MHPTVHMAFAFLRFREESSRAWPPHRPREDSPTLLALQDPILLLPCVSFRGGGFPNHSLRPSPGGVRERPARSTAPAAALPPPAACRPGSLGCPPGPAPPPPAAACGPAGSSPACAVRTAARRPAPPAASAAAREQGETERRETRNEKGEWSGETCSTRRFSCWLREAVERPSSADFWSSAQTAATVSATSTMMRFSPSLFTGEERERESESGQADSRDG